MAEVVLIFIYKKYYNIALNLSYFYPISMTKKFLIFYSKALKYWTNSPAYFVAPLMKKKKISLTL
jgi:hypothetical protein